MLKKFHFYVRNFITFYVFLFKTIFKIDLHWKYHDLKKDFGFYSLDLANTGDRVPKKTVKKSAEYQTPHICSWIFRTNFSASKSQVGKPQDREGRSCFSSVWKVKEGKTRIVHDVWGRRREQWKARECARWVTIDFNWQEAAFNFWNQAFKLIYFILLIYSSPSLLNSF
mgnify:CR=1 FL=1